MPDDIEEVIEAAAEPIPTPDHNIRPPWVDELVEAIEAIPDAIASALPRPPVPEIEVLPDGESAPESAPESVPESESHESPVSVPWTHKIPFRH